MYLYDVDKVCLNMSLAFRVAADFKGKLHSQKVRIRLVTGKSNNVCLAL